MAHQFPLTSGQGTQGQGLDNVQGDIIAGFPKKAESFYFFQITDNKGFLSHLKQLLPMISSNTDVLNSKSDIKAYKASGANGLLPVTFANIAFSQAGLTKLGLTDDLGDDLFRKGQLADSQSLGDPASPKPAGQGFDPDWIPPFKKTIDGVLLVAGSASQDVRDKTQKCLDVLQKTVTEVYAIIGTTRPGAEDGHEHFGFEDGIGQPDVTGLSTGDPGSGSCKPGVILLGRDGDFVTRPKWAIDGSFLVFRQLNQLVPEWNTFISHNALKVSDPTVNGADLLAARLVGRWKSGAPIQLTPFKDDPKFTDRSIWNKFEFQRKQESCPFAAHIRKSYPRDDLDDQGDNSTDSSHRILRRGIAFGPEVTASEAKNNHTEQARGLLFACYQSNIGQGFHFIQEAWVNNPGFPFFGTPGFDPIIGQSNTGAQIAMGGSDPSNLGNQLSLGTQGFVIPKGGEYFFSPSMSTLKGIATTA